MQSVEQAPRWRLPRWWPWAVAALVAVVAGAAAAWWLFFSARLAWPTEGPGAYGISVLSTGDSDVWTFSETVVCLDGVDSAVVESVEVDAGDALVTDFAVRPQPGPDADGTVTLLGSPPGRLADSDFGSRERTVRGRCDDEAYTELAVELTRRTQETAWADGLLVHWSSGIRSGTFRIPGQLVLCTEPDTSAGPCQPTP